MARVGAIKQLPPEVVKQTDVEDIKTRLSECYYLARDIRNLAEALHQPTRPEEPPVDAPEPPDVATFIKERLDGINQILEDAREALNAFV